MRDFERRNAEYVNSERKKEDDMADVQATKIVNPRQQVVERKSAAPFQQTASSAVTWISRRGAGRMRLVMDRLSIGEQTITRDEYLRRIRNFL